MYSHRNVRINLISLSQVQIVRQEKLQTGGKKNFRKIIDRLFFLANCLALAPYNSSESYKLQIKKKDTTKITINVPAIKFSTKVVAPWQASERNQSRLFLKRAHSDYILNCPMFHGYDKGKIYKGMKIASIKAVIYSKDLLRLKKNLLSQT